MTADLTRPRPPAPTGLLPSVPSFTLTSADLTEQGRIPDIFTVSALDVDTLGLNDEASPAKAAFTLAPHCIARATLIATYSVPGEPGSAAFLRDGQ